MYCFTGILQNGENNTQFASGEITVKNEIEAEGYIVLYIKYRTYGKFLYWGIMNNSNPDNVVKKLVWKTLQ